MPVNPIELAALFSRIYRLSRGERDKEIEEKKPSISLSCPLPIDLGTPASCLVSAEPSVPLNDLARQGETQENRYIWRRALSSMLCAIPIAANICPSGQISPLTARSGCDSESRAKPRFPVGVSNKQRGGRGWRAIASMSRKQSKLEGS